MGPQRYPLPPVLCLYKHIRVLSFYKTQQDLYALIWVLGWALYQEEVPQPQLPVTCMHSKEAGIVFPEIFLGQVQASYSTSS